MGVETEGMKDRLQNKCSKQVFRNKRIRKQYLFKTSPFNALISRRSSSSIEHFSARGGMPAPIVEGRKGRYTCALISPVKSERNSKVR